MKNIKFCLILCLSLALSACGNTTNQEGKETQTEEVKEKADSGSKKEEMRDIIKEEAAYSGQIDGKSIEVNTESKTMALQIGNVTDVDWNSIEKNVPVLISYYKNENGQFVLTKFEITAEKDSITNPETSDKNDSVAKKPQVIKKEGVYTGRIDANSVEINTGSESIGLQDGMVRGFNWSSVSENTPVVIEYFINENSQNVLTYIEIKNDNKPNLIKTEAAYVGKIDNNSIEVNTEMETLMLQIGDVRNVDWEDIPKNARVLVSYYKNNNGQNVLTDIVVQ
ncbi:hypothetical protein D0469_05980 [Peribacillus saganii]|uniref:Lipoprotein n=1 Tax=Peribacillus saganii TaxID=2303992 RepID=A0A372LRN1_9BACI|nr:hypothetical protein [Peribacillus saganii]RFU70480.1 hypothetical protein D0469_05980 [Peribacillus saganii]